MHFLRLIPFSSFLLGCAVQLHAFQGSSQAAGRIQFTPGQDSLTTWEARLQSEPDNLQLRGTLMAYYMDHGLVAKYVGQVLWTVQHHPESTVAAMSAVPKPASEQLAPADDKLIESAWEQALVDQADSGKVLYNAGLFFSGKDPIRAVHLFEQARQLESEKSPSILRTEATVYARASGTPLSSPPPEAMKHEDAQALQRELSTGNDPALLAEVGTVLIRMAQYGPDKSLLGKGTELMKRAISLDPANDKWKAAAEQATLAPPPPPPPPGGSAAPGTAVHISAAVAEANLLRKVDPVYPPTALSVRISGTVEFTATIGEDGHIQNLQLVRGHPLLVNAAKEAVLQYLYRPTLLNGTGVAVVAPVIVAFEAPAR